MSFDHPIEVSNSAICSAIDKSTGQVVTISQRPLTWDALFARSIAVQWQLNLPGVPKIIGVSRIVHEDKKTPFFVVTGFIPHGNFDMLISERLKSKNPSTFHPTTFSNIIVGIAVTISEIHSRSVLH
jgi:hypothetical protein